MATVTTKAPPLTTRFVIPTNCYTSDVVAFSATTDNVSRNATFETALYANPDGSAFAACQPPGWQGDSTSSTLAFSPAVCPESWVYHHMTMHKQVVAGTLTKTVTTAYCCRGKETVYPSGVPGLGIEYYSSNPVCLKTLISWQEESSTGQHGTMERKATFTTAVQPAWRVAWEETDRATLTPAPPLLTPGQSVSTWYSGELVTTTRCTGGNATHSCVINDHATLGGIIWAIVIPVVIVVALILAIWIWCAVHKSKKRKREAALRHQEAIGTELKPK